jgi:ankyrin repeat protein
MSCSVFNSIEKGDVTAVKAFLDAGGDVETIYTEEKHASPDPCTLLMFAAQQNRPAIVKLLVDRGANTTSHCAHGWTALMIAVYFGHDQVVPLVSNNALNNNGDTALMIALRHDYPGLAPFLLTPDNVDVVSEHGETALTIANYKKQHDVAALINIYINDKKSKGMQRSTNSSRDQAECPFH